MKRISSKKPRVKPINQNHIGILKSDGKLVNLAGYYDYLCQAYYLSQDYENKGEEIRPTGKEMLDAYVPPLFLEKAKLAGLPVPEYFISNGYFEPPAIVDPVNPFTLKGKIVLKQRLAKTIAKSLTRNYTYAVCCQKIPDNSRVVYFNSILGYAFDKNFIEASVMIWKTFSIPLAKIRLIETEDKKFLLSDISPLFMEDLRPREVEFIEEQVEWVS